MKDFEFPPSLTFLQAVNWATRQLDSLSIPSSRVESELMLGKVCASSRLDLYLMRERRLDRLESSRFSTLVSRRMRGEPVQYLTGTTEFYGREFVVSPAVLIPRPETELIVDHVRPFLKDRVRHLSMEPAMNTGPRKTGETPFGLSARFADIGTGSGVLAVTLALECPSVLGYATDVSEVALGIARKNAKCLLTDDRRLRFLRGSLLSPLKPWSIPGMDLIVSNPPYITTREMDRLPDEIRRFEPEIALDGGEDGLDFYRGLIDEAPGYLQKGGMIAVEIGTEQSVAVTRLMVDRGVYGSIRVVKDYNGFDRIVSAIYAGLSRRH